MLSYLHSFHAGNFADVHKHAVLSLVLDYLLRKPAPLALIDLYAGAGGYDLAHAEALKTAEAERGIARLWPPMDWPESLARYRDSLVGCNPDGSLRHYPGSPMQLVAAARQQDAVILNELHPREAQALQARFHGRDGVSVHQRDAHEALGALIPPPQPRGLLLIDPSYERKNEYMQMLKGISAALQRWRHGVYLLWYPLLPGNPHRVMIEGLARKAPGEVLVSEVRVPGSGEGMHGSGMLVINPNWNLLASLESLHPWFARLGPDGGAVLRNRLSGGKAAKQ